MAIAAPSDERSFDTAVAALAAINKAKADAEVSMGREVDRLVLAANAATLERVGPVLGDVLAAARCAEHDAQAGSELEDGQFRIVDAQFTPRVDAR